MYGSTLVAIPIMNLKIAPKHRLNAWHGRNGRPALLMTVARRRLIGWNKEKL